MVEPKDPVWRLAACVDPSATSSALHRVPNECLLSIFRLAAASRCSGTVSHALATKLMGVCAHWRVIIAGAPLLWTHIHLSCHVESVRLCLERSQNTNISLHLPFAYGRRKVDFGVLAPLLVPHHARISHLDLNSIPGDQAVAAVAHTLASALPSLHSLTVGLWGGDWLAIKLDRDRLPSLRCLKLYHTFFGTPSHPVLSQLTSLTLSDIRIPVAHGRSHLATPLDLLNILGLCTSLETFTYTEGPTWEMRTRLETSEDYQSRIIDLCFIQRFCMCGKLSIISGVIAHLSLPKRACIHLKVSDMEWDHGENPQPPVLQAVLPANSARLIPGLRDLRHIAIVASAPTELVFHAAVERTELLDIRLDKIPRMAFPRSIEDIPMPPSFCVAFATPKRWRWEDVAMRELVAALADEVSRGILPFPVETLVLQGALRGTNPKVLRKILAPLSYVEYLEIVSDIHSTLSILTQMSPSPIADTEPGTLMPCPRLSELVLTCEAMDQHAWRALSSLLDSLFRLRSAKGCQRIDNLHFALQRGVLEIQPAELELVRTSLEPQIGNLTVSFKGQLPTGR